MSPTRKQFTPLAFEQSMTVREVAKYLRVNPSTICRLLKAKQLPAFRVSNEYRFRQDEIDQWRLAQHAETESKKEQ